MRIQSALHKGLLPRLERLTDVPLDVAMEEEHPRIVGLESKDGIRVGVDGKDVTHGRLCGEAVGAARIVA